MDVKVDENKCTGCSTCIAMCPEIFEFGKDNKSVVKKQPNESESSRVKESILSCPEEAISENK